MTAYYSHHRILNIIIFSKTSYWKSCRRCMLRSHGATKNSVSHFSRYSLPTQPDRSNNYQPSSVHKPCQCRYMCWQQVQFPKETVFSSSIAIYIHAQIVTNYRKILAFIFMKRRYYFHTIIHYLHSFNIDIYYFIII